MMPNRPILPPDPATASYRQYLERMTANVDQTTRAFMVQAYAATRVVILDMDYTSNVRLRALVTPGPGAFTTYTIPPQVVKAFAYGQGDPMDIAGRPGVIATAADTTLLVRNQTRDQADFWVTGLSAYVSQESEPVLIPGVFREGALFLSFNAQQIIEIGKLAHYPASGGLFGAMRSFLKMPDLADAGGSEADGGLGAVVPFGGNGNPQRPNIRKFLQPFLWKGIGGGSDSSCNLTLNILRSIITLAPPARPTAAGVQQYTPPVADAKGTFVDIEFVFHGQQVQLASGIT